MTPATDFAFGPQPDPRTPRQRRTRRALWATALAFAGVVLLVLLTREPLDGYSWDLLLAPTGICGLVALACPTPLGRPLAFLAALALTPVVLLLAPYGFVVEWPAVVMLWVAAVGR